MRTKRGSISAIHATDDGHVHLTIDGTDFLIAWPDAMAFSQMLLAMSGASAFMLGVTDETFGSVARMAWDEAESAARKHVHRYGKAR